MVVWAPILLAASLATPVTNVVGEGRVPTRIPNGSEEFEVERPRNNAGVVVDAGPFGFSAANRMNATAIMRAIDHCRSIGASKLVLAPGTYMCFDEDHGLVVSNMTDFTLEGDGARLVFRRPTRKLLANSVRIPHDSSVLVTNCERCVVRNFSIDWDWENDPLCDIGIVVAKHEGSEENGSYFDLELPDWPQGHPWYGRPMPIQTMTPINSERTRLTGETPSRLLFGITEGHFGTKMAWLSPHSIRVWPGVREPDQFAAPVNDHYYGPDMNRKTVASMREGVNYRVFHYYYGKNGITMHSGRHVTVEDVRVLGCFGMPIVVDGSQEYGEFRRVVVEPAPGRPCAGTSDGCHVARSKGHLKFTDCVVSFQNDDGLNIHDCFTLGIPDGARRIRVTNSRGAEYLGSQAGNELELFAPNFRPLGWKGRLVDTEGDTLVVDRDLPPLEGEYFIVCDNTFHSDHIVLRGCVFRDTHFREIIQPSHVTVEDCRFIRTGSGFKMGSAHSREFWCEGRGARDVVIRRCVFEHDNALADWSGGDSPVFETYVRFPRPKPYPPGNNVFTSELPDGFDTAFHGDILVEQCRIVDPAGLVFRGNPVSNLIFRDNEIVLTGKRSIRKSTGSFSFGAAKDVFITGNRYRVAPSLGDFEPCIKGDVDGMTVERNTIEREASSPSWSGSQMNAWLKCYQCDIVKISEDGIEIAITGRDSQLYASCDPFVPRGNHFVYIRARTSASGKGQLFWMTKEHDKPSAKRKVDFEFIGDGQWHLYKLKPFWSGISPLIGLRLDFPPCANGTQSAVSEVRVEEEGPELSVDADKLTGVKFKASTLKHEYATIVWGGKEVAGRAQYGFTTAPDGRPHTYWFNLAKLASQGENRGALEWKGVVDYFSVEQLLYGRQFPVCDVEFVSGKPSLPPDPAVIVAQPADAIPRAGRPLELEIVLRNYGTSPVRGLVFSLDGLPDGVAVVRPEDLRPDGEIPGSIGRDTISGSVGPALPNERGFSIVVSDPGEGSFNVGLTVAADGVAPFRTQIPVVVRPSLNLPRADYPPEPKPVSTAPYEVGAVLFPGWTLHKWHAIRSHAPSRKPGLGWYDETNPETVDWQIKHLVENGISWVSVCWFWKNGSQSLNHWMATFPKTRYKRYLKWSVMWANHNPEGSHSEADQEKVARFWIENYFCQPEYMQIDDKPVVTIFRSGNMDRDLGEGGCRRLLDLSRKMARDAGYKGIWFVVVRSPDGVTSSAEIEKYKAQGFDMTCCYTFRGGQSPDMPPPVWGVRQYGDIVARSPYRWRLMWNDGVLPFLPNISTGFDNRPWQGERSGSLGGIALIEGVSVDAFSRLCREAKTFSDESGVRLLQVGPLDEWGEGSIGYPNAEYGFRMLETVRDTFGVKSEGGWPVNYLPEDVELRCPQR